MLTSGEHFLFLASFALLAAARIFCFAKKRQNSCKEYLLARVRGKHGVPELVEGRYLGGNGTI